MRPPGNGHISNKKSMKKASIVVLLLVVLVSLLWLSPKGCIPETCWSTGYPFLIGIALAVGLIATILLWTFFKSPADTLGKRHGM